MLFQKIPIRAVHVVEILLQPFCSNLAEIIWQIFGCEPNENSHLSLFK